MSSAASLAGLQAHADAWRGQRQRERDHAIWQDAEIRRLWTLGWSQARIAGHVGLVEVTVGRRLKAFGLNRTCGFRRWHAGLSEAELEHYRALTSNGWTAAEARAEVLRQRRSAA